MHNDTFVDLIRGMVHGPNGQTCLFDKASQKCGPQDMVDLSGCIILADPNTLIHIKKTGRLE